MFRKSCVLIGLSIVALLSALSLSGCGGSNQAITISIGGTGGLTVVDGGDTLTLTATLTNDSSGKGVTWALSGTGCTGSACGTLSGETATTATYTAPAIPGTALTVTVTATSATDTSKTGTFTITVPPALTITTTSAELDGTAGAAFSQQLASTTGEGTLTWTVDSSSSLPANWHLSTSGLLTGPASNANYSFSFKCDVTDSGTPTPMTASLTLTVTIKPVAITFTATPAATATVGTQYTSASAATGGVGTLSYSLNGTSLPAGLTLTQTGVSAGAIAGIPTTSQKGGLLTSFTVKTTDIWGDSATQSDGITVSFPALTLSNPGALTAYNGTTYTTSPLATLTPSGGSGTYTSITWAPNTTGGTIVPPGLILNPATGAITGTPTTNGTYNITATVTDSATETMSVNFTVTVNAGITITPVPGALPTAYANSSYTSGSLGASGGSGTGYHWTISSGALPSWLSFSSTSGASTTLTGTPTTIASAVNFTVKVTDSVGNTQTAAYSVTVDAGVTVNAPLIPTFYPGDTTYAATTFSASGGAGGPYSYTWAPTAGTSLPAGLSITQSGANAGKITGTPVNATDSSVTSQVIVTAKDSAGNTGASTTISITIQGTITVTTGTPLPSGVVGNAYSAQLAASGGSNSFTWSTNTAGTNSLAAVGLTLSSSGLVSGSSTNVAQGSATFTAVATDTANTNHTGSLSMSLSINLSLGITTATLSPTYVYGGSTYTGTIAAAGGASPYTWSIASTSATSAATLSSYGLSLGNSTTLNNSITGNVSSASVTTTTTLSITVQVEDHNSVIATQTYSLTLYPQLHLTSNLPSVAEGATLTTGQETVTASGGSAVGGGGGYNFTVTGLPVGLSSSVSGNVVSIIGTAPSSSGTNNFTVTVKDTTTNATVGTTNDESITVNAPGATVGGNITVTNGCGTNPTMPATTVNLMQGSTVVMTTTTTNGSYSFTGVAAGGYTIVPSYTGTGIQSEFYPASLSITASGNTLTSENFSATIGYTVTGTNLNYSGGVVGQIYLNLTSNSCGNNGAVAGTSVHTTGTISGGTFTIQGVPPGTYTLKTFEDPDTLGQGQPNAIDPVASNQTVTVNTTPLTYSTSVNVANPTYTTPSANPQFQVTQIPNGVLLFYQASTNGSKIEDASEYVVNWSESSTLGSGTDGNQFLNVAGTHTFKAIGPKASTVWILNNAILPSGSQFQVGHSYYFQVRSYNLLATQTHVSGAWWTNSTTTPTPIVSTATPCSGCTAVTTSITIPSGITINTGAPLYEGFFQQTGSGAPTIYATVDLTPTTGSALSYTVSLPNGAGWTPFAILDQNLDGLIDAGNPNDTNNNSNGYTITSSTTSEPGGTLASAGATAIVSTYYYKSVYNGGSSTGYNLNINVQEANQLPVAVELESGPNILYPIDLSDYCPDCGHLQWQTGTQLQGVTPVVNDTYTFHVWYLGNSTPATITGKVTGWNGGSTLTGAADLPYNLLPTATATTTPAFSWSLPAADSSATFQFWLNDNSVGQIWAIPSSNSNANGFSSSTTSLAWDVDPTDSTNTSTETTLNSSDTYSWSLEATDANNNQVEATTWFIP